MIRADYDTAVKLSSEIARAYAGSAAGYAPELIVQLLDKSFKKIIECLEQKDK